jgi:uncharacterized phage infection (PIP) family protein YhgE
MMVKHGLSWLVGGLMVLGLSGWCLAGEGEAPKTEPKKEGAAAETKKEETAKAPDDMRSIAQKLAYARRELIKSKPELAEAFKQIQDKIKQAQKEEVEFNAKLRTLSPEIDALEKKREEIEAARKKHAEESRPKREPRKK